MERGLPTRVCAQTGSSNRPIGRSGFIAVSPSVCRPLTMATGNRIDSEGRWRYSAKLRIVELLTAKQPFSPNDPFFERVVRIQYNDPAAKKAHEAVKAFLRQVCRKWWQRHSVLSVWSRTFR